MLTAQQAFELFSCGLIIPNGWVSSIIGRQPAHLLVTWDQIKKAGVSGPQDLIEKYHQQPITRYITDEGHGLSLEALESLISRPASLA